MWLKFIFDRFVSFVGLLILWPVLIVVAILIKVKMPGGPAFFTQKRVGRNGKLFTMYKFRSMTVDHGGSSVSVAGESRITPLGAKEDREVLKLRPGITGPASLKYRNEEELLATVDDPQRYNDEGIFPDKVRINRYYLHHYSFLMDIKMIFATVVGKRIMYAGEII